MPLGDQFGIIGHGLFGRNNFQWLNDFPVAQSRQGAPISTIDLGSQYPVYDFYSIYLFVPYIESALAEVSEGFKRSEAPKIEVSRRARSTELICRPDELIAVAADYVPDVDVPVFGLEDIAGLADLVQARWVEVQKSSALSGIP